MRSGLTLCLLAAGLTTVACNKDNGTGPSDVSCRTFATQLTQVTTSGAQQSTLSGTCFFNQATNVLSCTYASGGTTCYTQVQSYASAADYVDEIKVIPPTRLLNQETTTNLAPCGLPTKTTLFTYDGQRRLMRTVDQGTNATVTYTTWDSSGRPTAGANPGPPAATYTNAYSDANRTDTLTLAVTGGLTTTTTTTYNTDAIVTNVNAVLNPTTTVTSVITPIGTAKVCK
jgi:hypothetical protein